MRVIFLDIDGVLNNDPFLAQGSWDDEQYRWPHGHIDPKNVAHFNDLCAVANAYAKADKTSVVLSSTWRRLLTEKGMTDVLREKGYTGPDIIDSTPVMKPTRMSMPRVPRRDEIRAWLKTVTPAPTAYVILDDYEDANLNGKFVHTSTVTGLTARDVEKALKILNHVPKPRTPRP